ncbi:hypothetical protein CJ030_MR7G028088 [Morella rubra]|uniref:Uncharacterized protein n=1 Tax=Morella rubra TaxID=262757 RepID=A0A6A1V1I6_9ROSI|nr:hypothetical protein CJ030_MR7G028088 [Morella rubra]
MAPSVGIPRPPSWLSCLAQRKQGNYEDFSPELTVEDGYQRLNKVTPDISLLQTGIAPIPTENVLLGVVLAPDEVGVQRATQAPVVTITPRAIQTLTEDDPLQGIHVRPLGNADPGSSRITQEANDRLNDVENNLSYISKCMEEVRT